MLHLRKAPHINFVFPTGNFSFHITLIEILNLISNLENATNFDNVTHELQLSQSCKQEDFNNNSKFLHLIGPIIEKLTGYLQYLGFL